MKNLRKPYQPYIGHDTNATSNVKMLKLIEKYKSHHGIGLYWSIIEKLTESDDYKYKFSDLNVLRMAVHSQDTHQDFREFIDYCISVGLFASDKESFWSNGLMKRMMQRDDKIEAYRTAGKKGAKNRWSNNESEKNEEKKLNSIKMKDVEEKYHKPLELTRLLYGLVKNDDGNAEEPTESAMKTIEQLHSENNRDYTEIENIIKFSQKDNFWKSNIVTADDIKKHYSKLVKAMKNGNKSSGKNGIRESQSEPSSEYSNDKLNNYHEFGD